MDKARFVLTAALLAIATTAQATVYFQNTGVTAGWSTTAAQRSGSVTEVSSPVYKGSTSLRCRQIYETSDGKRYHAEAVLHQAQNNNTDRYYGQAMYIQSNWPIGEAGPVQQWATNDPSGPWVGMNFDGQNLAWDAVRGPMAPPSAQAFASIPKGQWVRVVTRINARTSGRFEVWVNGTQRLSVSGDWSTSYAQGSSIRWSTGIYVGWHNRAPVGPSDLSVWHDHFRITSSAAEADPVAWTDGGGTSPTPTPTPTPTPCSGCFSGYYRLTARHSAKAMTVQSASTANSANVFQWTYGGSNTNDEWQVVSIGGGYYRIVNRHSGKDLVVEGASTTDGANIFQYAYGGSTTNDEWAIVSLGTGYYRITNRNSGKSAEVAAGSTADGANVDQRGYSGATHQQWQLVSVP